MLAVEASRQQTFVKFTHKEIVVRQPLARKDRPAVIDQGQDDRLRETFVFGLDVVRNAFEFYICVVASYHGVTDQ